MFACALCTYVSLDVFSLHVCELIFLNYVSKPQQQSTYALTLFKYETKIKGNKVVVGKSPSLHKANYVLEMGDIGNLH